MLSWLFNYPGPLWRLSSILSTIVVVISVPVWGSVVLVALPFRPSRDFLTWALRGWNLFVLWAYRIKLDVIGSPSSSGSQSALVVSNHQSLFDIPVAYRLIPGHLRMVAKKELFGIPFFGWVLGRTGFVPIDRGNRTSGHQASMKIAENIQSGLKVWVAPEGTRGDGQTVGLFKKGSFAVAVEAHVPIVPIVLINSADAVPKGSMLPRTGVRIKVVLLPEISTQGYTVDQRGDLALRVHAVMLGEFHRYKL